MQEQNYFIIRKISFWFFTLLFIISTPIILFYSLGYKFNSQTLKFIKTGTISIVTRPEGAAVYLDGRNFDKITPAVLAELLPKTYTILLYKQGYYPYKAAVEVRPSFVSEVDAILIPQIKDMLKIESDFNVYRFFLVKKLIAEKIFVFSDQGIFIVESDFKNMRRLSSYNLGAGNASRLKDLIETDTKLIFWDSGGIFMIDMPPARDGDENIPAAIYKSKKLLKNVYLGIKDRYLIIHDGLEVLVLDLSDNQAAYSVTKLKDNVSEIVYDSSTETLYVKEKIPESGSFSLFKADFFPSLIERLSNEKNF